MKLKIKRKKPQNLKKEKEKKNPKIFFRKKTPKQNCPKWPFMVVPISISLGSKEKI